MTNDGNAILREIDVAHPAAKVIACVSHILGAMEAPIALLAL